MKLGGWDEQMIQRRFPLLSPWKAIFPHSKPNKQNTTLLHCTEIQPDIPEASFSKKKKKKENISANQTYLCFGYTED